MDELTAVAKLRPAPPGPAPAAVAAARARLDDLARGPAVPRRPVWRRPALAAAFSLVAVAGLAATAMLPAEDREPVPVHRLLDLAAGTAAAQPFTAPRPDQFAFQDDLIDDVDDGGRHREQSRSWQPVGDPAAPPVVCSRKVTRPAAAFDCSAPPAANPPQSTEGPRFGSAEFLAALPRDPDRLLGALRQSSDLGSIANLMANPLAPPDLRAALLRAVERIPGVGLADAVTDAAGRTGTAATWVEDGLRHELIFDPSGARYLGYRQVLLDTARYRDLAGVPAGTVVHSVALVGSGIVDKPRELP